MNQAVRIEIILCLGISGGLLSCRGGEVMRRRDLAKWG